MRKATDSSESEESSETTGELIDVLFLAMTAVLSGVECWKDVLKFGDQKGDCLGHYTLLKMALWLKVLLAISLAIGANVVLIKRYF